MYYESVERARLTNPSATNKQLNQRWLTTESCQCQTSQMDEPDRQIQPKLVSVSARANAIKAGYNNSCKPNFEINILLDR